MENFVGDLNLKKYEDYISVFDALSHPARIKITGILAQGRQYVSELARLANISRPLLYMHLKKLEAARLVTSAMEISKSGKAMKYYRLEDFRIQAGRAFAKHPAGTPGQAACRITRAGRKTGNRRTGNRRIGNRGKGMTHGAGFGKRDEKIQR